MELFVKFVHLNSSKELTEYAEKKMAKIEKKYDYVESVTVTYELDNRNDKENKGVSFLVKLNQKNMSMYTTKYADSFEAAFDKTFDVMERRIADCKEELDK